jgi:zinc-ribbon domain
MTSEALNCPACGAEAPPESRFCPQCGARLGDGSEPAEQSGSTAGRSRAPSLTVLLLAVSGIALVTGIVLVALGTWVVGLVLMGIALLLLAIALEAARRRPEVAADGTPGRALGSVRARAGAATDVLLTRTSARREILRRRKELMVLDSTRSDLTRELGEAVHSGAEARADEARERLEAVDEAIAAKQREMARIAEEAAEHVSRARLDVQPTELVGPDAARSASDPQKT